METTVINLFGPDSSSLEHELDINTDFLFLHITMVLEALVYMAAWHLSCCLSPGPFLITPVLQPFFKKLLFSYWLHFPLSSLASDPLILVIR